MLGTMLVLEHKREQPHQPYILWEVTEQQQKQRRGKRTRIERREETTNKHK